MRLARRVWCRPVMAGRTSRVCRRGGQREMSSVRRLAGGVPRIDVLADERASSPYGTAHLSARLAQTSKGVD